ncbi:hypothetical protein NTE_00343 [Candidatus Nitrososphaera evergladensis SR1]|uniref:Uncharacterized protein n=1 Tax=Candidatus Nitrososphaera evergladensis SR1 TaxID=1459636 RepID=A0A075MMP7_9ARCH|nr:hypothetical protein NTE_00343 [Candidatus Nitrososphaera evergladensis SR1]
MEVSSSRIWLLRNFCHPVCVILQIHDVTTSICIHAHIASVSFSHKQRCMYIALDREMGTCERAIQQEIRSMTTNWSLAALLFSDV